MAPPSTTVTYIFVKNLMAAMGNASVVLLSISTLVLAAYAGVNEDRTSAVPVIVTSRGDAVYNPAGTCQYEYGSLGMNTVWVTQDLANKGFGCGACVIFGRRDDPEMSKKWGTINFTITGFFTPSAFSNSSVQIPDGPYQEYFGGGTIPDEMISVCCQRVGGLEFQFYGHDNSTRVLISNVAGAGYLSAVFVEDSGDEWKPMLKSEGFWQTNITLNGRPSFKLSQLTTIDGRTKICPNVAPSKLTTIGGSERTIICPNVAPSNLTPGLKYSTDCQF